jgi:hypothetical protein
MSAVESRLQFCRDCCQAQRHTLLSRTPMEVASAGIYVTWTCEIWQCVACRILTIRSSDSRMVNSSGPS